MHHVTWFGWYWLAILVLMLAPEFYWALVNSANTISDNVWAAEQLGNHPLDMADWTWLHWMIALTLWSLFGWLSIHLTLGLL